MAVTTNPSTVGGGVTPMCDDCGVSLCWDISRTEYLEARAFWDAWRCRDCAPSPLSAYGWRLTNGREALAPEIEAVVAAFDEAHPSLDAPGMRPACDEVTASFTAALTAAGITSRTVAIAEVHGKPHHAVLVGGFVVDWNAVRHDGDAPVPLVHRASLAWPIEPKTIAQKLEDMALNDPEAFQALLAAAVARKRAKAA